MKCANPACENDPIPAGVKYCCEECRKSANRARKRAAYAAFIERNPGYIKALRNGKKLSSKDGPRKAPVYTEAQLAEIRAAHGGRGEICRNCKRPFIRRYPGQSYCYAPKCAKAAERGAMRMEAA